MSELLGDIERIWLEMLDDPEIGPMMDKQLTRATLKFIRKAKDEEFESGLKLLRI